MNAAQINAIFAWMVRMEELAELDRIADAA